MLTIQTAGKEILGNDPRKLYAFCGREYMIKKKYMEHLRGLYGRSEDLESVSDFMDLHRHRSLLSVETGLYVIRYDDEFVKAIDNVLVARLMGCISNFDGCLVLIYSDEKSAKKLDKHLPDNTVRFDSVSIRFIYKYLSSDFPELDDRRLQLISSTCNSDYLLAFNRCSQISNMKGSASDAEMLHMLNVRDDSTEEEFSKAVASKNVGACFDVIDSFQGEFDYLIINICNTMLELEKAKSLNSRSSAYERDLGRWTYEDVYNYFSSAYFSLMDLRRYSLQDSYDSLVGLISILRFSHIPQAQGVFHA